MEPIPAESIPEERNVEGETVCKMDPCDDWKSFGSLGSGEEVETLQGEIFEGRGRGLRLVVAEKTENSKVAQRMHGYGERPVDDPVGLSLTKAPVDGKNG